MPSEHASKRASERARALWALVDEPPDIPSPKSESGFLVGSIMRPT